jgi:hypothetical protein
MRLLLRLTLAVFLTGWLLNSHGQTTDSTRKKTNFFERRRQLLEQRVELNSLNRVERMERWANLPLKNVDSAGHWSLSFNPLGLLELQMAFGVGIGYQVTTWWQIWVESSALGQFYQKPAQSCIGGFREIFATKFYFGPRQSLFAAAEFRWKQVYYHDVDDFENPTTGMVLRQYTYRLEDIVMGGALWFGARIRISDNHRWRLEPSIGLGVKGRTVERFGAPAGYVPKEGGLDNLNPLSWSPRDSNPALIYFPATLRVVYVL